MFDTAGALIAVGALVLVCIAIVTYCMSTRGDAEFEKAYSSAALALLNESEKKEKKQKKKDNKKKEKQQLAQQQQQQQQQAELNQGQKNDTDDEVEEVKEAQVKKEELTQSDAPKQTTPKDSPPKRKPLKIVNVKDLDNKKVLARLSGLPDLEEGYVQYLTTCFRDSDVQKNNLSSEVKALQKKLAEANQKSEKLAREKNNVEQREKNEQNKHATLSAKLQTVQAEQRQAAKDLSAAQEQLRHRDEHATKENNNQRSRIQQLDNEIHSLRANNSKLVGQIKNLQSQLAAAPSQDETAVTREQIKELTVNVGKLEKVITEMEVSYDEKCTQIVTLSTTIVNLENTIKGLEKDLAASKQELTASKDELTASKQELTASNQKLAAQTEGEGKKDEEKRQLEQEKARIEEAYNELKQSVAELNRDVAEFHVYKKQQEELVEGQANREKNHEKELAQLKAEFQAKEQYYEQRLVIEEVKLAQAEAALQAEKDRVVEIPANNTASEPEVEEVFELKKTNTDLAAAPSSSGPSETEVALKKENERLQAKNDSLLQELRQRNNNLLEKTEAAPKSTGVGERKRVVEHVSKVTKKTFKAFDDEEAYIGFVAESLSGAAKEIAELRAAPAKNGDDVYRQVVEDLAAQLDIISELEEKERRRHCEELAQARKQKA